MRPSKMNDEGLLELALRLKQENGRVTIALMLAAGAGGHARISRIVREVNARPENDKAASTDGDGTADLGPAISKGVREAVDQLLAAIGKDARQAAAESDARSRVAEEMLATRHQAEIAGAQALISELEGCFDNLEASLIDAEEQRDASLEKAEAVQRSLTEAVGLLEEERRARTEERSRLETERSAAQQAERQNSDALHVAEVARAKAETTLRETRDALDASRQDRHRLEERCSAYQASRDHYGHEVRALRGTVDDLQRRLDAEHTTNRRLEQVLVAQLGDQTTPVMPTARTKKPSSKKETLATGT